MGGEVEVNLDGVDASDTLAFRRAVEHTFIVRRDEPHIGSSFLFPEGESVEQRRGRLLTQVEGHETKSGETSHEPSGTEPGRGMVGVKLAQRLGGCTEEGIARPCGNVAA
jgi:hypothetical protein